MRTAMIVVIGAILGGACTAETTDGEDFDPPVPSFCVLDSECEGLRDICMYPECVENVCTVRDLTDREVPLPIDPESGLPLGKHCRQ